MMMLLAHFDGLRDRRGDWRLLRWVSTAIQLSRVGVAPMSYLGRDPPETRERRLLRRHRV